MFEDVYLAIKWVHILSATLLFGMGLGSAFYMLMASLSKKQPIVRHTLTHVVRADWFVTTPTVIIQFVSGMMLVSIGGHSLNELWLKWALVLFVFTGACWLPVVWLQIKMLNTVKTCAEEDSLPSIYWFYNRWWLGLGILAFPTVAVIFYLMVFKPA